MPGLDPGIHLKRKRPGESPAFFGFSEIDMDCRTELSTQNADAASTR
jgi:hypothetical protein